MRGAGAPEKHVREAIVTIDGIYKVEMDSPMGKMPATLTMQVNGSAVSGSMESQMGKSEFSGGSVEGDTAAWTVEINSPMGPVSLAITVTVTGDDITGEVDTGMMGKMPISGKRA